MENVFVFFLTGFCLCGPQFVMHSDKIALSGQEWGTARVPVRGLDLCGCQKAGLLCLLKGRANGLIGGIWVALCAVHQRDPPHSPKLYWACSKSNNLNG